jgi:hypothetical protein
MVTAHLVAATKVAGLTYRLLSTTTMIGFLVFGIVQIVREARRNRLGG